MALRIMDMKEILLKELKRSTSDFVRYMKEYTGRAIDQQFSEETWDMRQVISHVVKSDRSVIELMEIPFKKKKKAQYSKYEMRDLLLNRKEKVKSPEKIVPGHDINKSIPGLLEEFELQRQGLISALKIDRFNLDSLEAFPHFQFGLLTRRDWLYLVCFHSDRHIAQIQEMLFCQTSET